MKFVVFGGGTGLSILLRGLKKHTKDITAVVTVADNGGGSGVLREDLGMLPPGDMRNCITALADVEPTVIKLLEHRFKEGYLQGQSMGNLLILAMYEIYGSYENALKEIGSIFRLSGKVLPMTLKDTHLKGFLDNGDVILGEKEIPAYVKANDCKIEEIQLFPDGCKPLEETLKDIEEADVIILGPGSLYTSVIPNMLIDGIPEAIKNSKAKVFYVCNLMTQPGETTDYNVLDHVNALKRHIGENIIDYVIVNESFLPDKMIEKYRDRGSSQILIDDGQVRELNKDNIQVIIDDFVEVKHSYVRHNSNKIGKTIKEIMKN